MAAPILNCVDSKYEADLRGARDTFLARLGLSVSDSDAQALIQELLLPEYLETLKGQEDVAAAAEDALRERRRPGVIDVLGARLNRDLAWLGDAASKDASMLKCVPMAEAEFDSYFSRVTAAEQLPTRFAAIEDIRSRWTREACGKVVEGPAVTKLLAQRAKLKPKQK